MEGSRTDDPPTPGLRERKKAKTRASIQAHALRLFREQGYDETSVEQIAEAAEVSPSTIFRYFPAKSDLVIYDDLDDRMIEAFRAQPPELTVLQALRATFRGGFLAAGGEDLDTQFERAELMQSVPELRAAMLDELVRTVSEIADLVAERTGRPADDGAVRALAGAVIGVTIAAWFASQGDDWQSRFLERIDTGMQMLESGFQL